MTITLSTITAQTEINFHTEAMIDGCKYLLKISNAIGGIEKENRSYELKKTASTLRAIKKIADAAGHLPYEQRAERDGMYEAMLRHSKDILTEADQEAFYQCF